MENYFSFVSSRAFRGNLRTVRESLRTARSEREECWGGHYLEIVSDSHYEVGYPQTEGGSQVGGNDQSKQVNIKSLSRAVLKATFPVTNFAAFAYCLP